MLPYSIRKRCIIKMIIMRGIHKKMGGEGGIERKDERNDFSG